MKKYIHKIKEKLNAGDNVKIAIVGNAGTG